MAREDRRLEPALAPASGLVSVDHIETIADAFVTTAPERDGAHRPLSQTQVAGVIITGLLAALGVALAPMTALAAAHHLFFAIFLLGG